jgi:hypothetical protein
LRFEYADAAGAPLDAQFADGPWLGAGATLYDADLRRVRRVRVSFGVGSGRRGTGALTIPDLKSAFDITLRNFGSSP